MSEYGLTLKWSRETEGFDYEEYNRTHLWEFEEGTQVQASAPVVYRGDAGCVNPEQAFMASLSSCHLLVFLAIANRKGFVVDHYEDQAVGFLEKNEEGKTVMNRAILKPRVQFSGELIPSREELKELHDEAHHQCPISNSVRTSITVQIEQ